MYEIQHALAITTEITVTDSATYYTLNKHMFINTIWTEV